MRKMLAGAIYAAGCAGAATVLGRAVRGPFAEGMVRDLATGAAIMGAAAALVWAGKELGKPVPPGLMRVNTERNSLLFPG